MFDDLSLEIGDLIFFKDSLGNAEHVAMYIGHRKHVPFVVHIVTEPYNSIMMTRLKPAEDRCSYEVYRLKQSRLSWLAVAILFRWVELQIPFAIENKRNLLERIILDLPNGDHPTLGRQVQTKLARETFESNFHQYVEAAGHMYSPQSSHPEGSPGIVGMSCSEAIVYAFNIAELLNNDALVVVPSKDLSNSTFIWNTEAYPTEQSYLEWVRPSLPLDASRVRAESLLEHCSRNFAWRNMTTLSVRPVAELPEERFSKADWMAYTAQLFADATLKRKEYLIQKPEVSKDIGGLPHECSAFEKRSRAAHTPLSVMCIGEGRVTPVASPPLLSRHVALSPAGMLFTSSQPARPAPEEIIPDPTAITMPAPSLELRFFTPSPPTTIESTKDGALSDKAGKIPPS